METIMNIRARALWPQQLLRRDGARRRARHRSRSEMQHENVTGALEEVVVTARKREESLQDTPISVTAFTAQGLAERGMVIPRRSRHLHAQPDPQQRLGGLRQQLRRRVLHSRHRPDRFHAEHRSRRRPVSRRGLHRALDRRRHGPASTSQARRSAARTAGHAVRPQHDRRCHLDAHPAPRAGEWRHGGGPDRLRQPASRAVLGRPAAVRHTPDAPQRELHGARRLRASDPGRHRPGRHRCASRGDSRCAGWRRTQSPADLAIDAQPPARRITADTGDGARSAPAPSARFHNAVVAGPQCLPPPGSFTQPRVLQLRSSSPAIPTVTHATNHSQSDLDAWGASLTIAPPTSATRCASSRSRRIAIPRRWASATATTRRT